MKDNRLCSLHKTPRLGLVRSLNKPKLHKASRLGMESDTKENILENEYSFPNLESPAFEAGFEKGQHGGIELEALRDIFLDKEIYQIYYGNWLRDYSQLVTKATIRPYKSPTKKIKNISHEGWVELIKILAIKEFVFELSGRKKNLDYYFYEKIFKQKYETKATRKNNRELVSFKDILGVYRPEEHIDNPKDIDDQTKTDDGTQLDVFFDYEKALNNYIKKELYKGEVKESLEIDSTWHIKKYITKDIDSDRPSSDTYASEQIELALLKGKNKDGFRHLGACFHVLEDFFAHSNFVEVALRKHGQNVYPWVEGMDKEDDYKKIPIVTGKFLIDDTIASIAPKMADTIFPSGFENYIQRKAGDRTFADVFILKYLDDLSKAKNKKGEKVDSLPLNVKVSTWKRVYLNYLIFIDAKSKLIEQTGFFGRTLDKALQRLGEVINTANNIFFNLFLESVNEDIKEEQTLRSNKNYGTNPTHTQLAKDSLNHPLNGLASKLAMETIKDIAKQVVDYWKNPTENRLSSISMEVINYMSHPKDMDKLDRHIIDWAKNNKNNINRAKSPTFIDHAHNTIERNINRNIIEEFIEFFK